LSKINHDRPNLRYIDNLRRELAREVSPDFVLRDNVKGQQHLETSNTVSGIPSLDANAKKIAISLLNLLQRYVENQSLQIKAVVSKRGKKLREKQMILSSEADWLEKKILEQSIELVFDALKKELIGDSSVTKWIDWLQSEAIRTDNDCIFILFEIGIKPAFEAVSKGLSKGVE